MSSYMFAEIMRNKMCRNDVKTYTFCIQAHVKFLKAVQQIIYSNQLVLCVLNVQIIIYQQQPPQETGWWD
jgi:hypothetical protein